MYRIPRYGLEKIIEKPDAVKTIKSSIGGKYYAYTQFSMNPDYHSIAYIFDQSHRTHIYERIRVSDSRLTKQISLDPTYPTDHLVFHSEWDREMREWLEWSNENYGEWLRDSNYLPHREIYNLLWQRV
jgi:hypothetical protein